MPVLADMDMAQEIILPRLQQDPVETLKVQGLIQNAMDQISDVRVDNFHHPTTVMLKAGEFYSLYAQNTEGARHLLHEMAWNWSRPQGFAAVKEPLVKVIQEYADIQWQNPCWMYYFPPEADPQILKEIRGEDHSLHPPGLADVPEILRHWPYGDPANPQDQMMISRSLSKSPSSGWIEDEALVSWALANPDTSLGIFHTLEAYRNRGIGLKVAADLAWKVYQEGWTPFCYVVAENTKPLGILENLGFVRSEERYVWLQTNPR